MEVYRVETVDGFGPYRGGRGPDGMGWDHMNLDHPTSGKDIAGFPPIYYRHAFPSIAKAERWMSGYGAKLKECGFILSMYEIRPGLCYVGRSGLQVVFDYEESEFVEFYEIDWE